MPTITPYYDPTKVLVGMAACFLEPYVPTSPPALPPQSQAVGSAWPSPWTPIGATNDGVSLNFARTVDDIVIEEQMTPVDKRTKSLTFTVELGLSQDTLQTMLWAYGGGSITSVAAASGVVGTSTLLISTEMTSFSVGLEGVNDAGLWRRILIPVVKSVASVKTTYRKSSAARMYELSLESLVDPSQVVIVNCDAPALP